MSYTPTEWESTDVVTATRMNALENAVGDMNMSYTPNTWSDGDILTAAKMNALEQAVASGGGGGGSSDFSIAALTVVGEHTQFYAPVLASAPLDPPFDYIDATMAYDAGTYDVVLYNGTAVVAITDEEASAEVSGNVESLGYGQFKVTGDCTITIS